MGRTHVVTMSHVFPGSSVGEAMTLMETYRRAGLNPSPTNSSRRCMQPSSQSSQLSEPKTTESLTRSGRASSMANREFPSSSGETNCSYSVITRKSPSGSECLSPDRTGSRHGDPHPNDMPRRYPALRRGGSGNADSVARGCVKLATRRFIDLHVVSLWSHMGGSKCLGGVGSRSGPCCSSPK